MFPTDLTSAGKLAYKSSHCVLRYISWLVYLYEGDSLTRPHPLSSTCHSSFIIKEVPGGHMAVVSLLLFCCAVCCSMCFVDMNGRVVFFGGGESEVVVWKGMPLKKSGCMLSPAISILSQSLPSAAAAKHLFPGPTLNSCSPHLSVKPSSESGISFIPSCWIGV